MTEYSDLEILGLVLLLLLGLILIKKVFRGLWTCFLGHSLGFGVKWRSSDDIHNVWAIITGATDGIGLQYAIKLAEKGYSLLIISRNEEKLKSVALSIKETIPNCRPIKILAKDFNRTDIYDDIEDEINSLEDIDVLVNNVGVMNNMFEYFTLTPYSLNESYFNVNMKSCTKLIEIVLPLMVNKRRGIIINISSVAGVYPSPLLAAYSASKAYMSFLSQSLNVEYESKGIVIQTVTPGQVATNLSKDVRMELLVPTAQQYVRAALKTVGIEDVTHGHWKHKLMAFGIDNITALLGLKWTSKILFRLMSSIRTQYYKKNNLSDSF